MKRKPLTKEEEFEQACIRGLFFLIFMLPTICFSKEYVDWNCLSHTTLTTKHEFMVCSDLSECDMVSKRLKSKAIAIKDVDGNIVYGVFYDVVIASSNLIDSSNCQ